MFGYVVSAKLFLLLAIPVTKLNSVGGGGAAGTYGSSASMYRELALKLLTPIQTQIELSIHH